MGAHRPAVDPGQRRYDRGRHTWGGSRRLREKRRQARAALLEISALAPDHSIGLARRPAVAAVHLYAQRALGYDAVQVGLVFLPLAFGTGLLSGGVSAIVAQRLVRESVLLLGWSSLALGWG